MHAPLILPHLVCSLRTSFYSLLRGEQPITHSKDSVTDSNALVSVMETVGSCLHPCGVGSWILWLNFHHCFPSPCSWVLMMKGQCLHGSLYIPQVYTPKCIKLAMIYSNSWNQALDLIMVPPLTLNIHSHGDTCLGP